MPESIPHRFGGIARLYGQAALERFLTARVAVIGVGGVGSWAVESLARSGVANLTLVDLDEICITNVNRQLHAMDGQIGRQKTEAMAERARAIHPVSEVVIVPKFFTEKTAAEILDAGFDAVIDAIDSTKHKALLLAECQRAIHPISEVVIVPKFFTEKTAAEILDAGFDAGFDAVIDAIDSTKHKALLLAECHRRGIFTVTCGGAGGRRDATRIRVTDLAYSGKDPLLHQLRRTLRQQHGFPKTPMGSKPDPLGIEAVFSDEPQLFSTCDGGVSEERPDSGSQRLNCTTGLGTVTHVTAAFGMIAAGRVLEYLASRA